MPLPAAVAGKRQLFISRAGKGFAEFPLLGSRKELPNSGVISNFFVPPPPTVCFCCCCWCVVLFAVATFTCCSRFIRSCSFFNWLYLRLSCGSTKMMSVRAQVKPVGRRRRRSKIVRRSSGISSFVCASFLPSCVLYISMLSNSARGPWSCLSVSSTTGSSPSSSDRSTQMIVG